MTPLDTTGEPGTRITAHFEAGSISIDEAVQYISDFVAFIDVPVWVNGSLCSQKSLEQIVPAPTDAEPIALGRVGERLSGQAAVRITGAGEVWVSLDDLQYLDQPTQGRIVIRQGQGALRTFRSGFGLAVTSAQSVYNFGGVADVAILEPTAGREALTTASVQLLQETFVAIDDAVSPTLAARAEANQSTALMQWIRSRGRYDLCGKLLIRAEPGGLQIALERIREESQQAPFLYYAGSDRAMIDAAASDERALLVLATATSRRQCEQQYLSSYCQVEELTDSPTVLNEKRRTEWSHSEQALTFRIASILQTDYFLQVDIGLGELSHGLPIVVDERASPTRIVLDPTASTFGVIRELHSSDYVLFGSMVKDFVRNVIFPRVAHLVPSSTRQGAEAFLKSIKRTRDVFEYELDDLGDFSGIWDDYLKGDISMTEAVERSTRVARQTVQVFEPAVARSAADVLPDVIEGAATAAEPAFGPVPPILRTGIETMAKLLTVDDGEPAIYGYRCFIALSDRAREERGEFFLQPHSTAVVWGGQKVVFVFEHHSGEFGLYYDLQASHVVASESGGGPFPTATIVLRDKIFIPVPDNLIAAFMPTDSERKRFEVRSDLLYTELRSAS
jgi:molecular chaperone HtpG